MVIIALFYLFIWTSYINTIESASLCSKIILPPKPGNTEQLLNLQVRTNTPRPFNLPILTISLSNWNDGFGEDIINLDCNVDLETCNETFNSFTKSNCQMLTYLNMPVCGGLSCFYNSTIGKCDGQCENVILQKCVSQVENPSQDSDCLCASSFASFTRQQQPTCEPRTCYGNSCSFSFFSIHRQSDNHLHGFCNNEKVNSNFQF